MPATIARMSLTFICIGSLIARFTLVHFIDACLFDFGTALLYSLSLKMVLRFFVGDCSALKIYFVPEGTNVSTLADYVAPRWQQNSGNIDLFCGSTIAEFPQRTNRGTALISIASCHKSL